ncbi:MAG: hypothetical protein FD176_172 [Rhodospirillaceae bacterium]|nr:MAG: hypothetical protein FD176_172 [Rhodospirillaceae bacterium]TNC98690.1 MAG: hypothetical protein FD119_161 [Stygiobacter sp.]
MFAISIAAVATSAQAAEIVYNREATATEVEALRRAAPEVMRELEALPPWQAWAADGADGRVAVRIESQAVCGATGWCHAYVLAKGKVVWRGMLAERADWPQH